MIDSLQSEEYGTTGSRVNAFQHVWGYFKKTSSVSEKDKFMKLINDFENGKKNHKEIYRYLYKLSDKYDTSYLIDSYFFDDIKL